ncbi:MAG: hypothetical protein PWP65_1657 [Clostridia bacterium]|nr:hypothetical protein [Clostridia bacterium]
MEERQSKILNRRDFLRYTTMAGTGVLLTSFLAGCDVRKSGGSSGEAKGTKETKTADNYPAKPIEMFIPSSEGGTFDVLGRAHGEVWGKAMGTYFTFSFYPGASGQVAYELFMKKPADGYTVLAGNIATDAVMYVLQNPSFKFEDLVFFCTLAVDPAVVLVRKESPYKDLKAIIEEGKKRKINVGVARWASTDTIVGLLIGEKTGAQINIVPYGGGNKARLALLQGEIDFLITKLTPAQDMKDQVRFLAIVQNTNEYPQLSQDCPTLNNVLGTDIPESASYRHWVVHRKFREDHPERYKFLTGKAEETYYDPKFKENLKKTGEPVEFYQKYRDEAWTAKVIQENLKLAEKYKDKLRGGAEKEKKGK